MKQLASALLLFFHLTLVWGVEGRVPVSAPELTQDEVALIEKSKNKPVKVGIIPNIYPMSVTPPEAPRFNGITVNLLESISRKTGLNIEFVRIPVEKMTPISFLRSGAVEAVAGTLKIPRFVNDPELVLSRRLFDATVSFVSKKKKALPGVGGKVLTIAIMENFQAGKDYVEARFADYRYMSFKNAEDCFDAVMTGKADFAVINKYIATYHLQKPYYSEIGETQTYSISQESCIAARRGSEALISIMNKGLEGVEGKELSNILMDFTVANPYQMTWRDILYRYRVSMIIVATFSLLFAYVLLKLMSAMSIKRNMYRDHLTGLLSSFGFEAEVANLMKKGESRLFIVDYEIVKFKEYNTAYGMDNGDALLCHVAGLIRNNFSGSDRSARIYADHFVTLVETDDLSVVINKIKNIGNLIDAPLPDITVTMNYGVYRICERSVPVKTLIDRAISARQSIRGFSDSFYAIYDEEMHHKSLEDAGIIAYMNTAIKNEEFYIVYQPKYDTYTESLRGCEALTRWKRQDGTIIMPGKFIDLFEKNGQIIKLDFYVLEKVCQFLRRLIDSGIEPVTVSVNFSRINLYDQNFVPRLVSIVDKYELTQSLLEIELTESALITDKKYVLSFINELHDYGFKLALDDFGTGYSSLNSLKDLPIDVLKLDREFIVYDEVKGRGQQIIRTLLQLTESLNIQCVAEGVETKEQLEFLRDCGGCDLVQGYYFSKPLDEKNFVEKLKADQGTLIPS